MQDSERAQTANEIADELGLDAEDVTEALRRLANRGMAERTDDRPEAPTATTPFRAHIAHLRRSTLPVELDDL